jgi:RNA polymerase sigma-70 factor (ECF subfamily)
VPVEVWLLRIARNLAVAAHRHRARHGGRTVELDLLPQALQPLAEDMEEPESAALLKEARTRLRALLAQLDPDKRELLVLRFVSRLTAREIGLVVGKSEQAVQKQLTRTLHALKERYDED